MTLPTISISLSGTHELTIGQIAKAFCNMDASQQAFFFEEIDSITGEWSNQRVFQWQFIRDEIDKTNNTAALKVLRELAEYAE